MLGYNVIGTYFSFVECLAGAWHSMITVSEYGGGYFAGTEPAQFHARMTNGVLKVLAPSP
jgi:hypothetical protein